MTYPFSIIGCQHGHIATFISHMTAKGHVCAGIYDDGDQTLVQKYKESYGISVADNAETLLAPSVSIVGSSAINDEKIALIETCERHGKHILLDKPIVTNRDGLDRLEAVFTRGKIQVGMLLPKRFDPQMHALKQQIDSGVLGSIVNISIRSPHGLSPASRQPWHFSKKQNGGVIIDLLIHDFDLIRWLTGKEFVSLQSAMSQSIMPEHPDFYDVASVQATLEGGTTVQLYADWHVLKGSGNLNQAVVVGTKGIAELGVYFDPAEKSEKRGLRMSLNEPWVNVPAIPAVTTAITDFLDRVEGKPGSFTHNDIFAACRAAVEADELAILNRNI